MGCLHSGREITMLKLPMIFGDGMILQRQKPIRVWGTADPGAAVTVALCPLAGQRQAGGQGCTGQPGGKECTGQPGSRGGAGRGWPQMGRCMADADGSWSVLLPEQEAASGLALTVRAGEEELVCRDVCIGEVWIAGGQSNMEYFMKFDAGREEELAKPPCDTLRFFDYPEISFEGELDLFDYQDFGVWRKAGPEELDWFSAVGYYFSRQIHGELGVPVGIVGCNWGGSPACAWMDRETLEKGAGRVWLAEYEESTEGISLEDYRAWFLGDPMCENSHPFERDNRVLAPGFTREEQLAIMQEEAERAAAGGGEEPAFPPGYIGPYHPWRPMGLYECMLKKIAPFTARGVIWYQGESDDKHPELYAEVFGDMIACWRRLWQDELPFLFVQLAPFGEWLGCSGEPYPELRRQQERVAAAVPSAWMASNGDAGMEFDIHPKQKRPAGERLALLALGHVYGKDILCDAPVAESAAFTEEGIRIRFRHGEGLHFVGVPSKAGEALRLTDGETGEELAFAGAEAGEGGLLLRGSFHGCKKIQIHFADTPYYEVDLYNRAGIPALPFCLEAGEGDGSGR